MSEELEVGKRAPDFTLTASDGREARLGDYRGRAVVLFFVREYN